MVSPTQSVLDFKDEQDYEEDDKLFNSEINFGMVPLEDAQIQDSFESYGPVVIQAILDPQEGLQQLWCAELLSKYLNTYALPVDHDVWPYEPDIYLVGNATDHGATVAVRVRGHGSVVIRGTTNEICNHVEKALMRVQQMVYILKADLEYI